MDITMQQEQALAIARMLVKAGVPMFLARPNPAMKHGFDLPFGWETNEPDVSVVDAWRPGWALCAVTGRTFDLVDIDPRSGGDERNVPMPHTYLAAETPSGGRHHFIKTLGVPSLDGKVAPGVDVKSGTLEGDGRGFAFIAPTVRPSKVDGVHREYRWVVGPEGPVLPTPDQLAADGTGTLLRARVLEIRRSTASAEPRRVPESVARREWDAALQRLRDDVAHWKRNGWGGEAHSGLLAHTTHLARLNPDGAEGGFFWAFRDAGAEPDGSDLAKLQSALQKVVPDIVVPDAELAPGEAFFLGGDAPPALGSSLTSHLGTLSGLSASLGAGGLLGGPTSSDALVAGGEGRRRFQPMSRAEAASIVAPDPLVDGLLLTNTKARISGPSGTGKTWVVLDLAAHVAAGMAWQGRTVRQGRVLYVAGEGAPSFDSRITAWETKHQRAADVDLVPDAPQLATDDWVTFCQEIGQMGYGLVVFDTQGSITIGLKENDNDHGNIAHARLDILRKMTGACLLLVHHTGWEEKDRPRGGTAWNGGMDTELVLSGTVRDLKLKTIKQKYIEHDKPLSLRTEKAGGGLVLVPVGSQEGTGGFFDGAQRTEHEVKVQALVDKITAYYAAGGRASTSVRSLVQVLRVELNMKGRSEMLREAAQRYSASLGMPVDLDLDEDGM